MWGQGRGDKDKKEKMKSLVNPSSLRATAIMIRSINIPNVVNLVTGRVYGEGKTLSNRAPDKKG